MKLDVSDKSPETNDQERKMATDETQIFGFYPCFICATNVSKFVLLRKFSAEEAQLTFQKPFAATSP